VPLAGGVGGGGGVVVKFVLVAIKVVALETRT